MSRIGKQPVTIPSGVKVAVAGQQISVEGTKGKLSYQLPVGIEAVVTDGKLNLSTNVPLQSIKAKYGSARAHLNNMVIGVSKGWKKNLEMVGVGFAVQSKGDKLVLSCGYSHDVEVIVPVELKCVVSKTSIEMEGIDRRQVGEFAANIRKIQKPEPYLGKGIKYSDEVVRRKAGKTGKK